MTITWQGPTATATIHWRVSYRDRDAGTRHHTSRLHTPEAVHFWHGYYLAKAWARDLEIAEFVRVEHVIPIALADLPAPGAPTAPPVPTGNGTQVRRFFRFDGRGPAAMGTGDTVRRTLHRMTEHGTSPDRLQLLDVHLETGRRTISLNEVSA
ncbi:hypothetical protein ABZ752_22645 [Streptomyces roseifaciens]